MCDISGASFRLGTVLESKDADTGEFLILDQTSKARAVGRNIAANGMDYVRSMLAILNEQILEQAESDILPFGQDWANHVELADADVEQHPYHRIRARFDPGMILDFPKIMVRGPKVNFAVRSCLTVCMHEMNSKSWTRFVVEADNDRANLSDEELSAFHSFANTLCAAINEAVIEFYQRDIRVGFEDTKNIVLEPLGQLEFFAADCTDNDVAVEIKAKYEELMWTKRNRRVIDTSELASVFRNIALISLPGDAQDQEPENANNFQLAEGVDLMPFEASEAAGKANSIMMSYITDDRTYYVGLVDNTDFDSFHAGIGTSKRARPNYFFSTGTTAEISASVGAKF